MSADPATLTLYPYRHDDCWVFDDARTGATEPRKDHDARLDSNQRAWHERPHALST